MTILNSETHHKDLQMGPDELDGSLSIHPLNLAVRFLLEVGAMIALGAWGATLADGFLSTVMMLVVPSIGAGLWVTFNVPGDRSRSGGAPVPVPGIVRLGVEAIIFGGAVFALNAVDRPTWALIFAVVTVIHYAMSYERILWLVRR
ncbi:MAG: YrdB family protein [Aggregatilineales bacterium]